MVKREYGPESRSYMRPDVARGFIRRSATRWSPEVTLISVGRPSPEPETGQACSLFDATGEYNFALNSDMYPVMRCGQILGFIE